MRGRLFWHSQSTSCVEHHKHSWQSKQPKGSSGPLYFPWLNKLAGQSHTPQSVRSVCAQQHPLVTRALPLLVALSPPPQIMDSKSACCASQQAEILQEIPQEGLKSTETIASANRQDGCYHKTAQEHHKSATLGKKRPSSQLF